MRDPIPEEGSSGSLSPSTWKHVVKLRREERCGGLERSIQLLMPVVLTHLAELVLSGEGVGEFLGESGREYDVHEISRLSCRFSCATSSFSG